MNVYSKASAQRLRVSIKNGELELLVKLIDFNGSLKPFIVRTLRLNRSQQRTTTEQHTLFHSKAELDEWITRDEFSTDIPEVFEKVKLLCRGLQ